MRKRVFQLLLIDTLGCLLFTASSYELVASYRYVVMLAVIILTFIVSSIKFNDLLYKEALDISFLMAIAFVVIFQLFGFILYSGLAKDMDFISIENINRSMMIVVVKYFRTLS